MNLFTNGMEVFEGFGLFDTSFFQMESFMDLSEMFDSDIKQEDEINYLQKGEKILTLLREKKRKKVFSKDDVLEKVKPQWHLTIQAAERGIGARIEEKFLETMSIDLENEEYLLQACEDLRKQFSDHIVIEPEERARERILIHSLCNGRHKAVITIKYEDKDMVLPVGAKFSKRFEGGAKLKSDRGTYIDVRNFRKMMAELYLRRYVLEKFKKMRNTVSSEGEYKNLRIIGKMFSEYQNTTLSLDYESLKTEADDIHAALGLVVFYPNSEEAKVAVYHIENYQLHRLLLMLQKDYKRHKEEARMEKVLSGDYARSFQTKKNIPQKYIKAMAKSGFNEYFGYVEFDEECDLALMEELYKEYGAFAKELKVQKFPEVSLRFRKLGNHKASGLYYYTLKCLCVDVRFPGSFVHEVGHAIDYHLDHISEKYAFHEVSERYEQLLKDYLKGASKEVAAVLNGKTKYNLQYYLMPTEIFARCFEIYVVRCRGVDNSLCKPESGFAYPEDEKLVELIRGFFDGILLESMKYESQESL